MSGGSVYKDHTFNKETSPKSHENSTIQEHEHKKKYEHYETQQKTEHTEENREYRIQNIYKTDI
jgi:hypothetical protein